MKFLPVENIIFKTKLSGEEVIRRISDNTAKNQNFTFSFFGSKPAKYFEGQINEQAFKIKRIINYRNSFLPVISGKINGEPDITTIKVKMRLHALVIGFMCIWFGGVIAGCFAVLAHTLGEGEMSPGLLIPFAMLLFGYILTIAAFKFESSKAKKHLQTIFEAEIVEA